MVKNPATSIISRQSVDNLSPWKVIKAMEDDEWINDFYSLLFSCVGLDIQPLIPELHSEQQLTNHQRELNCEMGPGDLGDVRTSEGNN